MIFLFFKTFCRIISYTITPQHLRCARECYMKLDARCSILDIRYWIFDTGHWILYPHRASRIIWLRLCRAMLLEVYFTSREKG
ncbi:MAG: hypothetical protein AB1797_05070 [bacterium]